MVTLNCRGLSIEIRMDDSKRAAKNAYMRRYNKLPHVRKRMSAHNRNRKRLDPRIPLLDSAKQRAKKFNLPINITVDDIIIPEYCPVFPDIKLEMAEGYGRESSPTLDRVIPSEGYVKGNVSVVSFKANRLKSNATVEELLAVISYMKNFNAMEHG